MLLATPAAAQTTPAPTAGDAAAASAPQAAGPLLVPPLPQPPTQRQDDDALRIRRGGGGDDMPVKPPDLSPTFDPFSPDRLPPPRTPPFQPARPDISMERDDLAGRIRGGGRNARLPQLPPPEAWRLAGEPRKPLLSDPPPDSAPATRVPQD